MTAANTLACFGPLWLEYASSPAWRALSVAQVDRFVGQMAEAGQTSRRWHKPTRAKPRSWLERRKKKIESRTQRLVIPLLPSYDGVHAIWYWTGIKDEPTKHIYECMFLYVEGAWV